MAIVRKTLDEIRAQAARDDPAVRAGLEAIGEEAIAAGAAYDPDNPLLSDAMLDRLEALSLLRRAQERTGANVRELAQRYGIDPDRLEVVAAGRGDPDPTLTAYLRVIASDPQTVARLLHEGA
ncbi:hypothetical protein [Salinarimonas ramus]|uniref:Uncharacterized protein n=1 Tax=Salinarimonas ramus TaxID=690164 RepID=A0A917Q7E4_9HYPH|nr:hypothetical protein [Salinarimonas ramus]GGK34121.1 hypothetical protein GCM10011322_21040 [Salinarimonas ramus]